jgi:CubicO group peptidase (beta-lactamase class C family)
MRHAVSDRLVDQADHGRRDDDAGRRRPGRAVGDPGRYGWDGGDGTVWFNDPHRDLIALAFTQVTDFLFAGGRTEFTKPALRAAD